MLLPAPARRQSSRRASAAALLAGGRALSRRASQRTLQRVGTIIFAPRRVVSAVSRYWLSRTAADPAAPAPAPDAPGAGICMCKATHAFAKEEPQEMSLDAGDFVLVLKAELDAASGWLFAEHLTSRSSGYVPTAYLAFVRDSLVMPAANAEAPLPALAAPTGIE